MSNTFVASSDDPDQLICEGYLRKYRGLGQSQVRFFRLTLKTLYYFQEDAGEIIVQIPVADVISCIDNRDKEKKNHFKIITSSNFGRTTTANTRETILGASTDDIKTRWMSGFEEVFAWLKFKVLPRRELPVAEGMLTKHKDRRAHSKARFFVLTPTLFSYFEEDAGTFKSSVNVTDLTNLQYELHAKDFKIRSKQVMTANGSYDMTLEAESVASRNRWLMAFKKVMHIDVATSHDNFSEASQAKRKMAGGLHEQPMAGISPAPRH